MKYNSNTPRLYALPKIHKDNIPLRPIISSINTISSDISKKLANILTILRTIDKFEIKNTIEIKQRLNTIIANETDILVSFDIISLFTNIPTNLAITIIEENWDTIKTNTDIPKTLFFEMLRFCLYDANYFTYNNTFYKQIFGMPMGNPLSSIIANIITNKLLTETIDKLDYTPTLLVKYVDDILAIIPKNSIIQTLTKLNNFHHKIQFTYETTTNNKLPYLDLLIIINNNNSIDTDWYTKKT